MLNWLRKRRRKSKGKTTESNNKPDLSLEHIYHEIEEIEENSCNSFTEGMEYITPTPAYAVVSILDGVKKPESNARHQKGSPVHTQTNGFHLPKQQIGMHIRENCHVCERLRETGFDCRGNVTCSNSKQPTAVLERKIPRLGTSISSSVIRSRSFSEKHKHSVNVKPPCHISTRLPDLAPPPQLPSLSRSFNENHRRKLTTLKQTTTHSTSALHHQRRPQPIGCSYPLPKVDEVRTAERRSLDSTNLSAKKTQVLHRGEPHVSVSKNSHHRQEVRLQPTKQDATPSHGINRSDSISSASSGDTYFEYDASSSASSVSDSNYQQALWTVEKNLKFKLDVSERVKSSTEQCARQNKSASKQNQRHKHDEYENVCPNTSLQKSKYKRSISSRNIPPCYLETPLFDITHNTRRSLRSTRSPPKRTSPDGILRCQRVAHNRDKRTTHHVTNTLPRSHNTHNSKSGVSKNQMLSDLIRLNHERQQLVFV